ncbi:MULTISPECIES: carbohydrate kinase [Streptacidiphilus]|uniref:Carbohydrate kinase n=1 Tax=Streptacidiphilus cavernicola TaxID=3342716 RepID=A0ABV6UHP6_9ACTN|nr:carbohydrate kinase [Streptacidiphilus jeojiense]
MTDFLVIGESIADIVRAPGQADVPHPGGSPANVAYGLARLGRDTALLTQLGDDAMGALISAHLRSAGVSLLSDGQQDVRTSTALVTLDARGQAGYTFDIDWTLRPTPLPFTPCHVHLGSIAAVKDPGSETVAALAGSLRGRATVSYDPNVRPALMGDRPEAVRRVERCVALSDLVKASDEDLDWLYPGVPVPDVAARWLALGPELVLVTRGGAGATGFTSSDTVTAAAVRTTVVDTVGAGDSFMSASLDALATLDLLGAPARPNLAALTADTVHGILTHAGRAAALTVSRAGANPPDREELQRA